MGHKKRVNTGSQVCNLAWSKLSSELVSFLRIKVVCTFVREILFLIEIGILFDIWYR
jgi:hypothetical protein